MNQSVHLLNFKGEELGDRVEGLDDTSHVDGDAQDEEDEGDETSEWNPGEALQTSVHATCK